MKLEKQVCSYKYAKKLKELGIEQDSYWWWVAIGNDPRLIESYEYQNFKDKRDTDYSAFTAVELGELLPHSINIKFKNGKPRKYNHHWRSWRAGNKSWWNIAYSACNSYESLFQKADTEADARAKMLIYLLEQGIITPEQESK